MEQSQQVSDNDVTQALTESGSLDISVSRIPVNENSMTLKEVLAEPNNNSLFNEQSIHPREKRFLEDEASRKRYKLRKINDESNSGKQYLDKEAIETNSDSSGDDDKDENSFYKHGGKMKDNKTQSEKELIQSNKSKNVTRIFLKFIMNVNEVNCSTTQTTVKKSRIPLGIIESAC